MGLLSRRGEDDEERDEIQISGLDGRKIGEVEELVYELDEWSQRDRSVLRERLETLAVPHRWEESSLVVAAADEAWVERVMDQVEEELSTHVDPDVEQVAYDLSGWDDTNRTLLADNLHDEAIPHAFEDRELLVHAIDEQRVDEMIDVLLRPDAEDAAPASGADADVMGELFVAADRLVRDPRDHAGTLALIDAIRRAEAAPAPYGMDKLWWDGVQAQATELVELMEGPDPDDESVVARAGTLREGLRPYV